jgi:hypothetical protein
MSTREKKYDFLWMRYTGCWYAWLLRLRCIPTTAALQLWNGEIGRIKQMPTKAETKFFYIHLD